MRSTVNTQHPSWVSGAEVPKFILRGNFPRQTQAPAQGCIHHIYTLMCFA